MARQNKYVTPTNIHNKPKDISKKKLKTNFAILQELATETIYRSAYATFYPTFSFAETIFKISSLNLFSVKPVFCYRKMLKFRGLQAADFYKYALTFSGHQALKGYYYMQRVLRRQKQESNPQPLSS